MDDDDDLTGVSPLLHAIWNRDLVQLDELLESGWRPVYVDDPIGGDRDSELHRAVESGVSQIVERLLRYDCADCLNGFDYVSRTPLSIAVKNGDVGLAKLLLIAGASPNAADERRAGNSPLADAVETGSLEMVRLLMSAGGDAAVEGWTGLTPCDRARIRFAKKATTQNAELVEALHAGRHRWEMPHPDLRECDDIATLRKRLGRML